MTALLSETDLLIGLACVLLVWAAMIGVDVYRRQKGLKRRTTSPIAQWMRTMVILWALAAMSVAAWLASGRSLSDFGFRMGDGFGLGLAWGMAVAFIGFQLYQIWAIRRDETLREDVRKSVFDSGDYDMIMPRRRKDSWGFYLVSITAGITEEVVFRAFLIGIFALVMPIWGAAALALFMFLAGHAYQGLGGILRITPISIILTLAFVLSGSLWPAIVLHVAVDILGGVMVWLALPKEGYVDVREAGEPVAQPA